MALLAHHKRFVAIIIRVFGALVWHTDMKPAAVLLPTSRRRFRTALWTSACSWLHTIKTTIFSNVWTAL